MKTIFAFTLILLATSAECGARLDDATLTKYVKAINVRKLDKTLPGARFEAWLLSGPAHIEKLEYLPGDCDLKPTRQEPKGGWPLCVKVTLRRGELWGHAVIIVGTIRGGIHGEPRLKSMFVASKILGLPGGRIRQVTKLCELPHVLAELEEAGKKARE